MAAPVGGAREYLGGCPQSSSPVGASGPSSLYAFDHLLKELGGAIPNFAMAPGFVMSPSTTALTAAAFVSNE